MIINQNNINDIAADKIYEIAKESVTHDEDSWYDVADIGYHGFEEIAKLCGRHEEAEEYYDSSEDNDNEDEDDMLPDDVDDIPEEPQISIAAKFVKNLKKPKKRTALPDDNETTIDINDDIGRKVEKNFYNSNKDGYYTFTLNSNEAKEIIIPNGYNYEIELLDNECFDIIGKRRGCLVKGGEVDYDKVCNVVMNDMNEHIKGVTFDRY